MIDLQHILDEALTIPPDKAGPVELKLRDVLEKKYKDFNNQDIIVKCCRNDEKSGKMSAKELVQIYIVGLGNIIDLFKVYDKCKSEYLQQKLQKKIKIERADGKVVELDPLKDLNRIGRLPVLKQFIEKFENLVRSDTSIQTAFSKYAINDHDRDCIRLMCWNKNVMVWGTKQFEPSQKFAVQLWQNIDTIDSGSAYGDPDEQCPYCTHSKGHWDNHADGDPDYEQYWYLKIPEGVSCTKKGDLNDPEVVKIYNALKGLGPSILVCQHDSSDDWCDRDDNPISEYDVDIHDADDSIYIDDDGEVVDPSDYEEAEEIQFNFGPGKEDYYDDVIELYDKWFSEVDVSRQLPQQPWESDREFKSRQEAGHDTFVGFKGDEEDFDPNKITKPVFDFEKDVWTKPINLKAEHFQDGILKFQLPRNTNAWVCVEGAEIASMAGFPTNFIGAQSNKRLKFVKCTLKSADGWTPSEDTKKGLDLIFESCKLESTFKLGNALGGAELRELAISRGTDQNNNLQDFSFLSGNAKLKKIEKLVMESRLDSIGSFEGLASSLEMDEMQEVFIAQRYYSDPEVRIKSFRGLPKKVNKLVISGFLVEQDAIKSLEDDFPEVGSELEIRVKNVDQDILVPLFKAIWRKLDDRCKVTYEENGKHVFDTLNIEPIFKALKDDKAPSRFTGLQKKNFESSKIVLDLSPRNMYEERAFLSSDIGFSESGIFDANKIPLFQNQKKIFQLRHGDYYIDSWMYAMVQDERIVCFSPSLDIIQGPFTKQTTNHKWWDTICLDKGEHGPDFNLDEALKVFLKTRDTDFPETKTLALMDGFTGKTISNMDQPDLTLRLCRGSCLGLAEVSKCNLAAFQDERGKTLHWDDKKTFESSTIYRDCIFSEGSKLEAKAVYNCTITQPEKDKQWISRYGGVPAIDVSSSEGIFNTKISSKNLGVRVNSPVVEGCTIESGSSYVDLFNIKKLASSRLVARNSIELRIVEDFSMTRDCYFESSGQEIDQISIKTYGEKTDIEPAKGNEIASAVASRLEISQIKTLNLYQLPISSLKFLEDLSTKVKNIQQVHVNLDNVKDFSFKLKSQDQVDSLGYPYHSTPHLENIPKDATLDGFDASVLLSLGYYQHGGANKDKWTSRVHEQFDKYFTQYPKGPYHLEYAMGVDPNYIDKNGQFAAPKTINERLFDKPTTIDESEWKRVLSLFR